MEKSFGQPAENNHVLRICIYSVNETEFFNLKWNELYTHYAMNTIQLF